MTGRIVLLTVGMSNTTMESRAFIALTRQNRKRLNPRLLIVDGAQGGRDSRAWADPRNPCWRELERRLRAAGGRSSDVRAVWLKHALAFPARLGRRGHVRRLAVDIVAALRHLAKRFPNLTDAWLSPRTSARWARTDLNPEPYAGDTRMAVARAIRMWNRSGRRPTARPGPNLWKVRPAWVRSDFCDDGVHPSPRGCAKVARILLRFFLSESFAMSWFVRSRGGG